MNKEIIPRPEFADPSGITVQIPYPDIDIPTEYEPPLHGIPPLSPSREWLHEHTSASSLKREPFVDFTEAGIKEPPIVRRGLELIYPGIANNIRTARDGGYDDKRIMFNIERLVALAMADGWSDEKLERKLFYHKKRYGIFGKHLAFLYRGKRSTSEKMLDYLGPTEREIARDWTRYAAAHHADWEMPIEGMAKFAETEVEGFFREKYNVLLEEVAYVNERALSGLTAGVSEVGIKAVGAEPSRPQTVPGAVIGSAANLVGYIYGPLKFAKWIIGGRLAPTATGLKGITQICKQGAATLGLARGISEIAPALSQSDTLTEAAVRITESAAMGGLIGSLYPLSGAIPSKPLRVAVGLAALDLIRGGGDFTIDDMVAGIADGSIDREELAERSFGYLMDIYFLSRVPSMKNQLASLEKNVMVKKILECNPDETEAIILEIRNANLIPNDPQRFLDGFSKRGQLKMFGSVKNFDATYRLMRQSQIDLARTIQADIDGKTTIRIPKELQSLAQVARQFRKPVNFANAVRGKGKLKPAEIEALNKTVKGDLKKFWQGVSDRDYLEKTSMIQHTSEAKRILDAMATERMYNKADIELQRLNSGKIRKAYQGVARAVWDTSATIKRDLLKQGGALGKEAVIRHDLIRGAGSKSTMILDKALHTIYNGLSKSDEITLNRIIQSRRTIAIDKYKPEMKHPAGLGLKEHQAYLDSIPKDTFAKLNQRADAYFSVMNDQVMQLMRAGIISRESAAGLIEKGDYSPRRFIQYLDPERSYTFGGKKITVWDSGIKALDEGSYKTLENNSRGLLRQVVMRTQARIFRNEANRAMYELAKQMPDNKVVSLAKVKEVTKAGKLIYAKPPGGYERVGVMIDGQMREMNIPESMAKEWVSLDPAVTGQFANVIGWISGARILRPMATGINPEFAVTNLPRDIAHAWITNYEYSSHLPVAAVQMAKDYAKVLPDTIMRRGRWHDYLNEGGGMQFLTHMGRTKIRGQEPLKGFQKVMGYLGETSEIWTRLALRERAIRNGKPLHEATWVARNYLDFSQGGWLIKGADTAVPYLNASVQGTRGIVRAAREKPGTFVYKIAEVGTLATGIYLANKYRNPECWESISDYDKVNNFIITTPLTFTDDEGNVRHLFFRVAKDQGQKWVCTIFENMMAKSLGEEIDIDQTTAAAKELITFAPQELLPPAMDAMLGYLSNKDFWRNEDIWKRGEIEPAQEYTQYTHPAFVKLGEVTGMSPERAQYALEQYFTGQNIYTSMVGGGLREIMDKLPEDVREQSVQDMLRQAPFLRRVLKATDPFTQYAKDVKEAKLAESTRRYIQTRTLDSMSELIYAGKADEKELRAFIAEQPWQDRERLIQRHRRYGRLYQIPDKRWWLNLIDMPPETAATVYWTRWEQSDATDKRRLDKYMRQVPGIVTDKFMLRLNQLKQKGR